MPGSKQIHAGGMQRPATSSFRFDHDEAQLALPRVNTALPGVRAPAKVSKNAPGNMQGANLGYALDRAAHWQQITGPLQPSPLLKQASVPKVNPQQKNLPIWQVCYFPWIVVLLATHPTLASAPRCVFFSAPARLPPSSASLD